MKDQVDAAQQNGTAWQWNLKGDINGRRDFDNGATVQDGINNTLEFATGRNSNSPDAQGILNIETLGRLKPVDLNPREDAYWIKRNVLTTGK